MNYETVKKTLGCTYSMSTKNSNRGLQWAKTYQNLTQIGKRSFPPIIFKSQDLVSVRPL